MNNVERFHPEVMHKMSGTRSQMTSHPRGECITYESHKQEIESLQARLDALQSKPRDSISISEIMAEHVEDALREAVRKTVEEMFKSEFKYNGDPRHSTTESIINELTDGPGETVKADAIEYSSVFTFGSNFGEGKPIKMSTAKCYLGRCLPVC